MTGFVKEDTALELLARQCTMREVEQSCVGSDDGNTGTTRRMITPKSDQGRADTRPAWAVSALLWAWGLSGQPSSPTG